MKNLLGSLFVACLAWAGSVANANDSENAVTLTIGESVNSPAPVDVSVSLNGDNITISANLLNQTSDAIRYGFFAYTPLFQNLGEAAAYADRTFDDINVEMDGESIEVRSSRKAFFLGQGITHALMDVGIAPLPNFLVDDVPEQMGVGIKDGGEWEGQILYSWQTFVPPSEARKMTVRYKALPQFDLEDISGTRFTRLVSQHCGVVSKVIAQLHRTKPNLRAVILQKYVLPVSFFYTASVSLSVSQPRENSLGANPLIVLSCGLGEKEGVTLPIEGEIEESDNQISILVISSPGRQNF